MNNVILIGRLTKDPELKYIPNTEKAVCSMSIAANRPFKKDEADFFNVKVFGKPAENCANYLSKGSQVGIQGRIQNNNYTTSSGEKRYSTEIIADRVEFLSSKNELNSSEKQNSLPNGFDDVTSMDMDDDIIPF